MMEMEMEKKINFALDEFKRKNRLVTDKELAKILSVSGKTISQWRHGRCLPKGLIAMVKVFSSIEL